VKDKYGMVKNLRVKIRLLSFVKMLISTIRLGTVCVGACRLISLWVIFKVIKQYAADAIINDSMM